MTLRKCVGCLTLAFAAIALFGASVDSKTRPSEIHPQTLLPENSFLVLTYDGSAAHLPAIRETAAWKALEETQLTTRLMELVQVMASAGGSDMGVVARRAAEHLRAHGFSVAGSLSSSGQDLAPYGVVVLHDAAEFQESLEPLVRQVAAQEGQTISQKTLHGRTISVINATVPDVEVAWWAESGHLVIGVGLRASEQIVATAMGQAEDITKHPHWTDLRQSSGYTVDGLGWLDIRRLLERFGETPLPPTGDEKPVTIRELAELVGLQNIQELTAQSGYRGAQTWRDFRLHAAGPLTGLFALLQQRTLSLNELPPMAKGTTGFAAATFDAAVACDTVLQTVRRFLQRVEPAAEAQLDEGLAQVNEFLGGDPRTDLIGRLGDVWCLYSDPGAMPIPIGFSPVAAVSVKDKAGLVAGVAKLMELLKREANNPNFSVRQSNREGREYFSFNFTGMPFVPTIMISDKWLVVSLTPGSAQSLAQRESGKIPGWTPPDSVVQALREVPQQFSSISLDDPAPTWQQLLQFAPMAINLLETQMLPTLGDGSLEMPFGVEDLPAVESITEPMFPNISVGFSTATGIGSTSRESVPSNPLGTVSAGVSVPVLIALLLPAVQQAREAARRTQSRNNLKQIALALHNYHDTHNQFPDGTVENEDLEPDERLSWQYSILPFIEQADVYNQIDPEAGWESESNQAALQQAVPVFQNPSQSGNHENPSAGDYVGMAGVGKDAALLPARDKKAGIFGYNRKTGIRDITDGTSNTIMVTDASTPNVSYLAGGSATILGFSQSPYLNGPDGIGSPHAGVVQILLADGSVRAVSVDIDEAVLEALATKAGGEVVPEF